MRYSQLLSCTSMLRVRFGHLLFLPITYPLDDNGNRCPHVG